MRFLFEPAYFKERLDSKFEGLDFTVDPDLGVESVFVSSLALTDKEFSQIEDNPLFYGVLIDRIVDTFQEIFDMQEEVVLGWPHMFQVLNRDDGDTLIVDVECCVRVDTH